ncbi:MAG: TIGR00303 family protein [Phormidesmis sp.]
MIEVCAGEANAWLQRYRGKRPAFACILSFTDTGLIPGISAAGQTLADRCHTAAKDGNFLLSDRTLDHQLPRLPAGISPAIITRAVLRSLSIHTQLFNTGLPTALLVPHTALPSDAFPDGTFSNGLTNGLINDFRGGAVFTGKAMSITAAQALFTVGQQWGQQIAPLSSYWVIGECIVGGTTTAQAVLTALGYDVKGRISSSHLIGNHLQKQKLVAQGLAAWKLRLAEEDEPLLASPLGVASAIGDPMQIVAAGMILAVSQRSGVLLAGGAQMLAVYALAKALAQQHQIVWRAEEIVVGTTRWVIEDKSADTVAIAQQIKAPYLASQLDFSRSPYMQLRAYEQGFVKEGVGAGGCAIAAHLYQQWSASQLRHAVEAELRQAF